MTYRKEDRPTPPKESGGQFEATEALAKHLYDAMESHYPGVSPVPKSWDGLDDQDRDYFRVCVESLLEQKALVKAALGISDTNPATT